VQRGKINQLPELPFALPDLFFCPLALGDVDHGAHKLNHLARVVADGMGNAFNIFYGLVRKNDAVVVFGVVPPVKLTFDPFDRGPIIWMHSP